MAISNTIVNQYMHMFDTIVVGMQELTIEPKEIIKKGLYLINLLLKVACI